MKNKIIKFWLKISSMKKIIYTILIVFALLLLLFVVFNVLLFCGKIQDYTYLNITNDNKEHIINLLREQEESMFSLDKKKDLKTCYKNLKRIEVVYCFPDGEDYVLYCQQDKISFSLDNTNYNLPRYLGKNGKIGFRFK